MVISGVQYDPALLDYFLYGVNKIYSRKEISIPELDYLLQKTSEEIYKRYAEFKMSDSSETTQQDYMG